MTWRAALLPATLTGVFCCAFTVVVGVLTTALGMGQLVALSFVSGFLGSLFARLVVKGRQT